MKKLYLFLIGCSLAGSLSYAQTSSGNLMLGGGFFVQSGKVEQATEDFKHTSFSVSPSAGYFAADNLAVGLNFQYQSFGINTNVTRFHAGPLVRYYKPILEGEFAFYGEAGALFGSRKVESDNGLNYNGSDFQFYLLPGFSYFPTKRWALEFQLQGLRYQTQDPNKEVDDDKWGNFVLAVSFTPVVGVRYFIGE